MTITNAYTEVLAVDQAQVSLPSAEVSRLRQWISQAQAGHAQTVLLTGDLGSGKSTFLDVARQEARQHSFLIGELALPGPRLIALGGPGERARRVVAAGLTSVSELLRVARLSADRWLISLDDAHAQDPEEVAAVARLVSGPQGGAVLFIIGAAEGHESEGGRLSRLSAQLGATAAVEHHRIGPWTGLDVQDLILARTPGLPPAVRFGYELAHVTGGNPSLIRAYTELAVGLPEDERLTVVSGARRLTDLVPPPLVQQLVQARTAALTGDVRRLLQTLALWGLPADRETLAELTGLETGAVESVLNELEEGGFVRLDPDAGHEAPAFELPDQATALVLAHTAPSLLAQRIHRHAASLLEERELAPGARLVRAEHHLAAGDLTAHRAEQVVEAAGLLLHRGRWASARSLLSPATWAAIERDLPSDVLVAAVRALAETYARGGDALTAERLVAATRPRWGAVEAGYLDSLQQLATGWEGAGRELEAETTLRYVAAHPRTPRHARFGAFSELVRLYHWHGDPEQALDLAALGREAHRDEADAHASLWFQEALVTRMQGRPHESLEAAREAARLGRRSGDRGVMTRAYVAIGEAWLDSDSADRASLWMRGALKRAERSQVFRDVAWVRNRLISAYIEAGDWTNAELAARRGLSFAASLNLPQTLRRSEAALAMVQALTGRTWPAFLRSRVTASDMGNPLIMSAVMTALYEQQRLAARPEQAHDTIRQAAEMLQGRRGWERLLEIEVLPRLAASYSERRDLAGLMRVTERFTVLFDEASFILPIARLELMVVQGRQSLLEGNAAEAASVLELARSGYQGMDYRWRWAQLAGLLGEAYVQSGRRSRAVDVLRSGYVALERLGARPEARRVRAALQAMGAKAPRVQEVTSTLTPKQTEVAILAARGLSDREIAREMGTSVRTTTTHMTAVLRRLGLRSRFEIGSWLEQQSGRE